MSYNIQKLIRSKIQKFLNISLVNLSIDAQVKDTSQNKDTSANDILRIFKKEIDDANIDKQLKDLVTGLEKDKKTFFDKLSISSNYLLDDGAWNTNVDDREDKLNNERSEIEKSIPQDLKGNPDLKHHIEGKIDLLVQLNKMTAELKEMSDDAKSLIEENVRAGMISNDMTYYENQAKKLFDVKDELNLLEISDNLSLLEAEIETKKLSIEIIEKKLEQVKNLREEEKDSASEKDLKEFDQLIKSYENEIQLTENAEPYLNKKLEVLKVIKVIDDNDKEIQKFINKHYKDVIAKKSASKKEEEIKRVIGDIDNEELVKRLALEFEKHKTNFDGITEYLLTEIMQSITTDTYDTIDIYKTITQENVISQLYRSKKDCKIKMLTNLIGKDSANEKLGIRKEVIDDGTGKFSHRFGIINDDYVFDEEYFNLNEIIYGSKSDKDKITPIGVSLSDGKYSKKNPLMSYTMILDPQLKASKRNELELSVFLNALSTIELSKSTPYFNAMFLLPDAVMKGGRVYKTASITQFLNGTKKEEFNESSIEKALHSKYNKKRDDKIYSGVKSNMSLFTSPQTLNNFDDVYVGRLSEAEKERLFQDKTNQYTRANGVHDITRPFMTIKSFGIDVAPTQGLLSMKTGKISLVIHDKTRMAEIAPFIKPDMFGAYGAELLIEYGWNNIDGQDPNAQNYIGEFIDGLKVREKYIITNSSFNITRNGEVNVDLSIAMRGPIDIKNVFLTTNSDVKISMSRLKTIYDSIRALKDYLQMPDDGKVFLYFQETIVENIFNKTVSGKSEKEFMNSATKNEFGDILSYVSALNLEKSTSEFRKYCLEILEKSKNKTRDFKNLFDVNFKQGPYQQFDSFGGNFFIISNSSKIPKDFVKRASNLLTQYYNFFKTLKESIKNSKKLKKIQKEFIEKNVMKSLGVIDPFFDKEWGSKFKTLKNVKYNTSKKENPEKFTINTENLNSSQFTKITDAITSSDDSSDLTYVTLGTLITSIIGTHLKESAKYDDIQIISYNVNKNAGLMSGKNISSLLVARKDIKELASDIFTSRSKITLEGFLSRIIEELVSTNKQICYGLKDLYIDEDKGKEKKEELDTRLSVIGKILDLYRTGTLPQKLNEQKFVEFQLPRIKMYFDTFVKKEAAEKTILRITLYDENDNPYKELCSLFTEENELLQLTTSLNRQRAFEGEESSIYKEKSIEIFKELLEKKYIKRVKDAEGNITYEIDAKGKIKSKQEIKKLVPSVTYGSQNSGIIEASVTTVNEGNLGTVLMTRNDRKTGKVGNLRVTSNADLPLQILPSKASVTMFGCPIVNFAQYMFLDFETGTTVDNFYAITGINHNLTPGNFTTNLTLSYGDAYGKYFSALSSVENLIQRTLSGKNKPTIVLNNFINTYEESMPANIDDLDGKNYIDPIDKSFNNQGVKKIISSNDYEIKLKENVTINYQQNVNFTSKAENFILDGKHLGSIIHTKVNTTKLESNKITNIEIVLTHNIYRTENFVSRNLVPNYKIQIKDILNLIFEDEELFKAAINLGE